MQPVSLMIIATHIRKLIVLLRRHKRFILKRFAIYLVILAIVSPFVFMNRTTIYKTLLSRHDDWKVYLNEEGLLVTDYGYQAGVYVGPHITPRLVATGAISYYNQFQEGNETAGVLFNNTIEWLLNNFELSVLSNSSGNYEMVHWTHDFAIWDLPLGWHSSMVDAMALNALALSYKIYNDSALLLLFDQISASFEVPVSHGGNVLELEDGTSWYPEYVVPPSLDPDYRYPLILNGFLFTLLHIYNANQMLNSTRLSGIFQKGAASAAANLHKYDSAYNWTLYHSASPIKLASYGYHQIHIDLTGILYEYTNITAFDTYNLRWTAYTTRPLFTWEEILSWEFISNGLLIIAIICGPIIALDIAQISVRRYLRGKKSGQES